VDCLRQASKSISVIRCFADNVSYCQLRRVPHCKPSRTNTGPTVRSRRVCKLHLSVDSEPLRSTTGEPSSLSTFFFPSLYCGVANSEHGRDRSKSQIGQKRMGKTRHEKRCVAAAQGHDKVGVWRVWSHSVQLWLVKSDRTCQPVWFDPTLFSSLPSATDQPSPIPHSWSSCISRSMP
jgi:hypothetical protein